MLISSDLDEATIHLKHTILVQPSTMRSSRSLAFPSLQFALVASQSKQQLHMVIRKRAFLHIRKGRLEMAPKMLLHLRSKDLRGPVWLSGGFLTHRNHYFQALAKWQCAVPSILTKGLPKVVKEP